MSQSHNNGTGEDEILAWQYPENKNITSRLRIILLYRQEGIKDCLNILEVAANRHKGLPEYYRGSES